MIEAINQFISKGKIKLALRSILQLAEELNEVNLKTKALSNLSRLESVDEKLLDGIISFQESELAGNQIRISTISLSNELEFLVNTHNVFLRASTDPVSNIIGKWVSEYYSPFRKSNVKLIWCLREDYSYSTEFQTMDGFLLKKGKGNWKLDKNNIFQDVDKSGNKGLGIIEWLNTNKIVFTIKTSTCGDLSNFKRIYDRV